MNDTPDDPRLEALRRRWEAEPSPQAALDLAEAYLGARRPDDGVAILRQAVDRQPGRLAPKVALGRYLAKIGHRAAAIDCLEGVVASDPTHLVANKLLVDLHLAAGQLKQARDRLDLYSLLNSGDPEIEQLEARLADPQAAAAPAWDPSGDEPPPLPAAATAAPAPPAAEEPPSLPGTEPIASADELERARRPTEMLPMDRLTAPLGQGPEVASVRPEDGFGRPPQPPPVPEHPAAGTPALLEPVGRPRAEEPQASGEPEPDLAGAAEAGSEAPEAGLPDLDFAESVEPGLDLVDEVPGAEEPGFDPAEIDLGAGAEPDLDLAGMDLTAGTEPDLDLAGMDLTPGAEPDLDLAGMDLTPGAEPDLDLAGMDLTPEAAPDLDLAGMDLTPGAEPDLDLAGMDLTPEAEPDLDLAGMDRAAGAAPDLDPAASEEPGVEAGEVELPEEEAPGFDRPEVEPVRAAQWVVEEAEPQEVAAPAAGAEEPTEELLLGEPETGMPDTGPPPAPEVDEPAGVEGLAAAEPSGLEPLDLEVAMPATPELETSLPAAEELETPLVAEADAAPAAPLPALDLPADGPVDDSSTSPDEPSAAPPSGGPTLSGTDPFVLSRPQVAAPDLSRLAPPVPFPSAPAARSGPPPVRPPAAPPGGGVVFARPGDQPFSTEWTEGEKARVEEALARGGVLFGLAGAAATAAAVLPAAAAPAAEPESEAPVQEPPPAAPREVGATVTLARLYQRQGHLEEARQAYREVLARNPDDAAARRGLAELGGEPAPLTAADLLADADPGLGGERRKIALLESYLRRLRAGREGQRP